MEIQIPKKKKLTKLAKAKLRARRKELVERGRELGKKYGTINNLKRLERDGICYTNKKQRNEEGLTDKQKRFVEEYLVDFNKTPAAIRAGYNKNIHSTTIDRLLSRPHIQLAIRNRQLDLREKMEIDRDMILMKYLYIINSDPSDYFSIDENDTVIMKRFEELTEGQRQALAEVHFFFDKNGHRRISKFKLHDKKGALDAISKHLGLFEKDNLQKNTVSLNVDEFLNALPLPAHIKQQVRNNLINEFGKQPEQMLN